MKTINKTYKVYAYNELSPEAKEKALSKWIENNDYYFLEDCLNERLHELLGENGIVDTNDTSKPGTKPTPVQYSLGHSQGDGCMFEGSFIWKGWSVHIKHSGHYYHSNSKIITLTDENGDYPESDDLEEEFENIYQSICKQLENYGYDFIDTENSEENFIETCEANEYNFLSDGTMVNE